MTKKKKKEKEVKKRNSEKKTHSIMLSHKNFFRPKRWHEMVYDYKNIAERKKLMPLARNVKESITKETRLRERRFRCQFAKIVHT